jgi:hypothetical protein
VRSWELNEELARALNKTLAQLTKAMPAEAKGAAKAWATALALAALALWFKAAEDEWELIDARSRRFLAAIDALPLIALATQFLGARP